MRFTVNKILTSRFESREKSGVHVPPVYSSIGNLLLWLTYLSFFKGLSIKWLFSHICKHTPMLLIVDFIVMCQKMKYWYSHLHLYGELIHTVLGGSRRKKESIQNSIEFPGITFWQTSFSKLYLLDGFHWWRRIFVAAQVDHYPSNIS